MIALGALLWACSTTQPAVRETPDKKIRLSLQLGTNKGGITENTIMEDIPGAGVDAFSGATRNGINAGARLTYPLGKISLETGLDYMFNQQTFTYKDSENGFEGLRDINTSQWMVPLTFNIGIWRKQQAGGLIQLKPGMMMQFNLPSISDHGIALPDYQLERFSFGATLGISVTPWVFANGASLGVYGEVYRGSRIYTDYYNQKIHEVPGSSYYKTGLIFKLPSLF